MRRTMGPRKDLDNGDAPAWVRERPQKMPTCLKCGSDVPNARELHTVCAACTAAEMPGVSGPVGDPHRLIAGIISRLPDLEDRRMDRKQDQPKTQPRPPQTRQDRLRELFGGAKGNLGGLIALALRAGYTEAECREAVKIIQPTREE